MCSFAFTMIWNDLGATSFRMACVSVWGAVGAWGLPGVLYSWFRPRYLHRKTVTRRLSRKLHTTVPADGLQKQSPIVCPCAGCNPNGKANFQSASSRTYVSFTKWEIHVTQLPRFVVEKWRQPACFCCEINSSRGMLHQPHLGMVSDLYTCFGKMSSLFHR